MTEKDKNPIQEVEADNKSTVSEQVKKVLEGTTSQNIETDKPVKFELIPGRILKDHEDYPGKPAAYFVRSEGTTDTLNIKPDSLEDMMQQLFGSEALDFIVGINSPDSMKESAQELMEKLQNLETQKRIRTLYNEQRGLRKELLD